MEELLSEHAGEGKLEASGGTIFIFDERPLRREAYICLLTPWANANDLKISGYGLFDPSAVDENAVLAIVCVGNRSVNDLHLQRGLSPDAADLPLVVISDLEDAVEVAAALQVGAKGFVPTTALPDLAVNALTFVMSGGEFFPVSVLRPADR